jgi:hypothetical protein
MVLKLSLISPKLPIFKQNLTIRLTRHLKVTLLLASFTTELKTNSGKQKNKKQLWGTTFRIILDYI